MSLPPIENMASAGEEALRALLRGQDEGGLQAQEIIQKGAMHAVNFLLEQPGDMRKNAERMKADLERHAIVISEECARRGLPVVRT